MKANGPTSLLVQLRQEHRDLDEVTQHLRQDPLVDQLLLRRLKAKKLHLKDQIARLASDQIPDLDA